MRNIISLVAVCALVCFSGCRLLVGEMSLKDFSSEIMSFYCSTNTISK